MIQVGARAGRGGHIHRLASKTSNDLLPRTAIHDAASVMMRAIRHRRRRHVGAWLATGLPFVILVAHLCLPYPAATKVRLAVEKHWDVQRRQRETSLKVGLLTVVISAFQTEPPHPIWLERTCKHLQGIRSVDRIIVVWHNPVESPPLLDSAVLVLKAGRHAASSR